VFFLHKIKVSLIAIQDPVVVAKQESNSQFQLLENKTAIEPDVWLVSLLNNTDNKPATICVPPKAGTTTFYKTLYNLTHGEEWAFQGPTWVQNMGNTDRWTKVNAVKQTKWTDFHHNNAAKSIALIRDPKSRILSSWKSKAMCHKDADKNDQRKYIPQLLKLAGLPNDLAREYIASDNKIAPCLGLSEFLQTILQVHSQGKDGLLNEHFRPQHLYCFLHAPPSHWDIITMIDAPDLTCQLKTVLGMQRDECLTVVLRRHHGTGDILQYANLTARDNVMLDAITRKEYDLLSPYL
jgi:hypothetical protein